MVKRCLHTIQQVKWCNMTMTFRPVLWVKLDRFLRVGEVGAGKTSELRLGKFVFCAFPEPVSLNKIKESKQRKPGDDCVSVVILSMQLGMYVS